jgi:co-chaperonin GroES (HSP10)
MENLSGLKPLGRAVLVKYDEMEQKGLIVIPDSVRDRNYTLEQRATVIEAGAAAWKDEPEPRAFPGDRVLVSKMAGYLAISPVDGQRYAMVNDKDIFAKITKEKENG